MAQTVQQIMTPYPVVVDVATPAAQCAKLMDHHEIGALGVVRDGRLFGVVTDRDIVVRAVARDRDPATVTAGELASTQVVAVTGDALVEDAERRMVEHAVRRLFVVADDDRPIGILTADDLTAYRHPDSVVAHQIGEWGLVRADLGFAGQGD